MKRHYIIPIFVPHAGCPHACVFCSQKDITGQDTPVDEGYVQDTLAKYLQTIPDGDGIWIEAGFFGGSFTGIPLKKQQALLAPARAAKEAGALQGIRLSTRPDYIDPVILQHLADYRVDTVEIGVQSFSDAVLAISRRGHTAEDVRRAAKLIQQNGFQLGIQLMVGLPEDTRTGWMDSVAAVAAIRPDMVRLYPTLVLAGTVLEDWMQEGFYRPLTLDEAVEWCRDALAVFMTAGIPVIRIGLQPTEEISPAAKVVGGPYHPAFRQLVESSLILCLLKEALKDSGVLAAKHTQIRIVVPKEKESDYRGQKNSNLQMLQDEYPCFHFRVQGESSLAHRTFLLDWGTDQKLFYTDTLLATWVQGRQPKGTVIQ